MEKGVKEGNESEERVREGWKREGGKERKEMERIRERIKKRNKLWWRGVKIV